MVPTLAEYEQSLRNAWGHQEDNEIEIRHEGTVHEEHGANPKDYCIVPSMAS